MEKDCTKLASITDPYPNRYMCKCVCSPTCPSNKIIVRGLSPSVDEKSLLDAFSGFGEVKDVIIMYDHSGKSRGHGFVKFIRGDDAICAKDAMDGKVCH